MCGINGIFAYHYAANPIGRDELRLTRDHMAARGPDGAGEWIAEDERIGFGHRRLAIIDLSDTGIQPMASTDGKLVITFNGEIFSYDDKLDYEMVDGRPRGPAALAAAVDLNLISDPGSKLKYAVQGGLAHFHPECADPTVHRPYDVPFRYDVTFVGQHYGFRPFFIDNLRHMGIDVQAFGKGWPNGAVPIDRMVEMYSLSRINLGFGGIGHSRRLMCLKGRDFEVPISGGLYLTQDNPELALVFDVGREVVTYRDEADCAAKIRELLADEPRAAAIRNAGRARCLKDHTYAARWTKVFEMAGIL